MIVYITEEISTEVKRQFDQVASCQMAIDDFFSDRFYGEDVHVLYIGLLCTSPRYEEFMKIGRPTYKVEPKTYIYKGVQVERPANVMEYHIKLDFEVYVTAIDIRPIFAKDILDSLDKIATVKKIKDFDLERFRKDFEQFFMDICWL
ncbi:hypothetical protein [Chitinophaga sp. RAB17]|uniref:hypothetical protein n=1 Tax=Chitinophaga sp. RAB17 TaxID=3233049 RepID=UPI003F9334AF